MQLGNGAHCILPVGAGLLSAKAALAAATLLARKRLPLATLYPLLLGRYAARHPRIDCRRTTISFAGCEVP